MQTKSIAIWIVVSLLALIRAQPVLADVAPPEPPPGGNPGPGQELTQVQMAAETVVLEVHSINASSPRLAGDVAQAKVTASFTMRNLGPTAERMQVRFPLGNPNGWGDGFGNFPEVTDLTATVDQKAVPTTRITTPNPNNARDPSVPWAAFDVTFPPGKDVLIEVRYTLLAEGYLPYAAFTYILETGSGWRGSIGTADVIVRFPYDVGPQNILTSTGWSTTTPGGQFVGREIRWRFQTLEPTRLDNMEVSLVAPYAWQSVLNAREAVKARPEDGDAWGALARAYKNVILVSRGLREDAGGVELYQLSVEAYEKALALTPQTSKWHSGYAELLWNKFYWYNYFVRDDRDYSLMVHVAQELQTALELDPQNEQAQQLLDEISGSAPEAVARSDAGYSFLILTATPTPWPTQIPVASDTPTPLPSATRAISSTATPPASSTPEPAQPAAPQAATPGPAPRRTRIPVCGAANIALLVVVGLMSAKRRRD